MEQTKYDVFISYSRKDIEIVNRITQVFEEVGITYFVDRKGIGGGLEFPAVLARAIRESKVFLFLASKNSYSSKFTQSEIVYAFNKKQKEDILPYIIDGSSLPDELEFTFSAINWRRIEESPIETVLVEDIMSRVGKQRNTTGKEETSHSVGQPLVNYKIWMVAAVLMLILFWPLGIYTSYLAYRINKSVKTNDYGDVRNCITRIKYCWISVFVVLMFFYIVHLFT